MFIYNFNEKGLDKFERDVNECIRNSKKVTLVIENKIFRFATLLNSKRDIVYISDNYKYLEFSLEAKNLSKIDLRDIVSIDYINDYEEVEHCHRLFLEDMTIHINYIK